MTTQEIANRLVELCRQGDFETVHSELYSQDAESVEPEGSSPMAYVKGLDKIREKGKYFAESVVEHHGGEVGNPIVAGNFFSLYMSYDATFKEFGRVNMEEICVYEVKDGKIVKEQFFFTFEQEQKG